MKIVVHDKYGAIVADQLDHKMFEMGRELPGKRRWRGKELLFELSPANIEYLITKRQELLWDNYNPVQALLAFRQAEEDARQQKMLEGIPEDVACFPFKTKPYDHQLRAFHLSRDKENYGLFMEMGTGKTKVLIDTAAYLYQQGLIDTVVVLAPNGVHTQWIRNELKIHMPDWTNYRGFAYSSNQTKKWVAELDAWKQHKGLRVVAINIDAMSGERGKSKGVKFAYEILGKNKCMFIIDESTRIKSSAAQRTKNVLFLRQFAKYRRIASGAPITQGVEDLYTQLLFLSEMILGFTSKWTFEAHYCVKKTITTNQPRGTEIIIGYKNLDELKHALEPHTFRVTKKECLDLPDKVYMIREVELTPEQRKHYRELVDDLITKLDTGEIVEAPMAAVKMMKIQQVLCGFLITEEGQTIRIPSNRINMCMEALQEAQGKVIVFTRFKEDIIQLAEACQRLGIGYTEYHGGTRQEDRASNIERFRDDPACKAFLVNSSAGGTGLNLAFASTAIYYSNDFNADTRWQSEDRIHRIGQKNVATYIDLVAPATVDGKILTALKSKKNVAVSVLDVKEMLKSVDLV